MKDALSRTLLEHQRGAMAHIVLATGSATPSILVERVMDCAEYYGWRETVKATAYGVPKILGPIDFDLTMLQRATEAEMLALKPENFLSERGFDHTQKDFFDALGIDADAEEERLQMLEDNSIEFILTLAKISPAKKGLEAATNIVLNIGGDLWRAMLILFVTMAAIKISTGLTKEEEHDCEACPPEVKERCKDFNKRIRSKGGKDASPTDSGLGVLGFTGKLNDDYRN